MNELTQETVRELFDYRDGNLYWKVPTGRRTKIGDLAGSIRTGGYRSIQINGERHLAHRLIFLYHHRCTPKEIDHIDGNPSNNNIANLRESTRQENQRNQGKTKFYNGKSTSSRFKGVSWHKQLEKYAAYIMIGGKQKHLGLFDTEIEAARVYDKAAVGAFGEFVRINLSEEIYV